VTETFLVLNGFILTAKDEDCIITMLQLASGEIDENEFADWIRGYE
jgi:death on curing protein